MCIYWVGQKVQSGLPTTLWKNSVFGQPSISCENILLMFSSLFHLTGKSERFLYFLAMVDRQYSISSFFHVNDSLQFMSC